MGFQVWKWTFKLCWWGSQSSDESRSIFTMELKMNITIIIYLLAIALAFVFSLLVMVLYHAIFNKTSIKPYISIWIFGILLFLLFLYWM